MRPRLPPIRATRLALHRQSRVLVAVAATIVFVGLAIDLAAHLDAVLTRSAAAGHPGPGLRFALYRATDILLRQMPIIAIVAGFLAEMARIRRGEAVVLAAAGASLAPAVAASLVLAIGLGLLQTALERNLRPAAVWAQVELGLGDYAHRFRERWTGPRWLDVPEGAVRANLWTGAEPALRDLIYLPPPAGPGGPVLIEAEAARPGRQPGSWQARSATVWSGQPPNTVAHHDSLTLPLGLDPHGLRFTGVPAFYLEPEMLRHLRAIAPSPETATATWRRLLSPLLPGAYLLMGVALAALVTPARGVRIVPLLTALFIGYLWTVALRVCWTLGEMGSLPAPAAAGAPILGVWAVCALLILRLQSRGPVA